MPGIFYVRSKLLTSLSPSELKLYQIALHRFLEGSNGANLEKLHNSPFHSIRVNKGIRLFLSRVHREDSSYWLWVDVMDDHNYKKALSNTKHWLSGQQEQMQECCFDIDMSKDDAFNAELMTLQEAPIQFRNQGFILLDSHQQQIKPNKLPLIVTGPPGAGKSCLAPSLLLQYIDQSFIQEKQYLVYLAQSNALVALMRNEWVKHVELNQVDTNRFEVLFLTMEDLYKHPLCGNNNAPLHLVSEEHFYNWLKRHDHTWEKQVDKVYQECRTMSGYSQFKDYDSLVSATYCLFSTKEDRQKIWTIYQSYLGHLNNKECIHLPFHQFKSPHLFDFMVIDEAQDGSRMQLRALAGMVKEQRICYLVGDHQRLVGSESTVPFLKSIFFDIGLTASHESLRTSYRCSQKVVELANAILQLKYQAIGSSLTLDKNELLHMTASLPDVVGNTYWLKDEKALLPLERDNENAEFAVITSLKYKLEAQERFGVERVLLPEEAKGLEYKHVLLYRIFDQEPFKAANKTIGPEFILYKNPAEQEIMKRGEGSICYNTTFNELFVSVTRSQLSVSIYQPQCPMTRHICKALEVFCNSTPSIGHVQDIAVHSSVEQCQLRADRLREHGLEEQASAMERRVKPSKQNNLPLETISPILVTKKTKKMPPIAVTKLPEWHSHLKLFYQRILNKDMSAISNVLNNVQAESLLFNTSLNSVNPLWPKCNLYSILITQYEVVFSKAINKLSPKNTIRKRWSEVFIYLELDKQHPDVPKIKEALVCVDINKIYEEKFTLLGKAIYKRHLKAAQELLKHKEIDINKTSFNELSPLYLAAVNGDHAMIQELLKHKDINVNKSTRNKETPLFIAVRKGYLEIAQELLKQQGIEINTPNNEGFTALHIAVVNGNHKIVQVLLKKEGIDINADINGNKFTRSKITPLYIAVTKHNLEIVRTLLKQKGIEINTSDNDGFTLLHIAITDDHLEIVQELLKQEDIGINTPNEYGIAPLHYAAVKGRLEMVNLLLKKEKIDINQVRKDKSIPSTLSISTENEDLKVVQEQKEIHAHYGTALFSAVEQGHIECVEALIIAGADVQIPIVLTESVLRQVFQLANEHTKHLLSQFITEYKRKIPKRYNPSLFCMENQNILIEIKPIQIAKIMGRSNIVPLLQMAGKTIEEPSYFDSSI